MCDMFGHAYWNPIEKRVIADFLKFNSHSELLYSPSMVYQKRILPEEALPKGTTIYQDRQTTEYFKMARYDCVPAGVNPVDGRILFKGPEPPEEDSNMGLATLMLAIEWDITFPKKEDLFPWIENHFGKRNDWTDWANRAPLLVRKDARDLFFMKKSPTFDGSYCWAHNAEEVIDGLRKAPNKYWRQAEHQNRRDKAKYVLDQLQWSNHGNQSRN